MILGVLKQMWDSLRWEDTGQYRRLFFAGWKIEFDGMWMHGAKNHEEGKEAGKRLGRMIADQISKEMGL